MGRDLNKYIANGTLGRDPEARSLSSGAKVVSFSIAISDDFKRGDEWVDRTLWMNCQAWEKLGDRVESQIRKGDKISIEGKLEQREWTDQGGNKRISMEVRLSDFTVIRKKDSGQQTAQPRPQSRDPRYGTGQQSSQQSGGWGAPSSDDLDQEIPF